MDIALNWINNSGDISFSDKDFVTDDSLKSVILMSIFTDKRVGNERGVWFDSYEGFQLGSRLWLIDREKRMDQVPLRANEYVEEALSWLKEEGVIKSVKVDSYLDGSNMLQIPISVTKPDGVVSRFEFVWGAIKRV